MKQYNTIKCTIKVTHPLAQYSLLNNMNIDKGCATELLKIKANGYSSGRDYGHAGSHGSCNILVNKPTFIQAYM